MKAAITTLNELLVLDRDAVRAFTAAIDRVSVPALAAKLVQLRTDHERHASDLTALILQLGGTPRVHADLRGAVMHTLTAAASRMGDGQALRALQGTEQAAHRRYTEALAESLPAEAERLVRRHYQDEVRHLAWLNQAIADGLYEQAGGEAQL